MTNTSALAVLTTFIGTSPHSDSTTISPKLLLRRMTGPWRKHSCQFRTAPLCGSSPHSVVVLSGLPSCRRQVGLLSSAVPLVVLRSLIHSLVVHLLMYPPPLEGFISDQASVVTSLSSVSVESMDSWVSSRDSWVSLAAFSSALISSESGHHPPLHLPE